MAMTQTQTPLRDALHAAIESVDACCQHHPDRLDDTRERCDCGAICTTAGNGADQCPDASCPIHGDDPTMARLEAAVEAARAALRDSDEPREWQLTEEGEGYDTITATREEAMDEARARVDRDNYSDAERTLYVDIRIRCEDTDEEDSDTVTLDVPEPDCDSEAGEHDWRSPYSLLGGIEENPGCWGHGGGVIVKECCAHCGTYRETDTWAQRRDTGEQGLTEVTYQDADEESLAWLERRAQRDLDALNEGRIIAADDIEEADPLNHGLILNGTHYEHRESVTSAREALAELQDERRIAVRDARGYDIYQSVD